MKHLDASANASSPGNEFLDGAKTSFRSIMSLWSKIWCTCFTPHLVSIGRISFVLNNTQESLIRPCFLSTT